MFQDISVRCVAIVLAFVLLPSTSWSQGASGRLSGTVVDETDAAVAAATLTITNDATSVSRTGQSTAEGTFVFPGLPTGRYTVRVQREGFAPFEMPNVVVSGDDGTALRIQLRVAAIGEQVVVTAQRRAERLQDVPIAVTVVDADALASTGQVLFRDYYSSIPGLQITPNVMAQQGVSIRGITTGAEGNPTVSVVVDDVTYVGATHFTGGNLLPDLDPGDLARIEVLRGPQGTLYGANSMGGLLKFVTREPATDRVSGRLSVGSSMVQNGEGGYNLRASVNVPVNDTFAVRASGFTRQDPGWIDNPLLGKKDVNDYRTSGARLSARWQATPNLAVRLGGLYQQTKSDTLSEVTVSPARSDLQQEYIAGPLGDNLANHAYSMTATYKAGQVELMSITGYSSNRTSQCHDYRFYLDSTAQFGVGGTRACGRSTFNKVSQELRLSFPIGRRLDMVAGGFYTKERGGLAQTMFAQDPLTGRDAGQWQDSWRDFGFTEAAAFATATYRFTHRFDVQVGGRESRTRVSTGARTQNGPYVAVVLRTQAPLITPGGFAQANTFTYLIAPRFRLTPELMVYARAASGYRPGGGNTAVGAPTSYEPDSSRSYEVGIKGEFFNGSVGVEGSVYHTDWQDIQLTLRSPVGGFTYIANGAQAKSDGQEISVTSRPLKGFTISAWGVHDRAVLTEDFAGATTYGVAGDRLPNIPRYSAHLGLSQDFPLWRGTVGVAGAEVSYIGERVSIFQPTPVRQIFPGYTRTNLRFGIRQQAWDVTFFINNVADVRGLIAGGIGYGYPFVFIYNTPRTVGLTLTRTF